MNTRLADNAYLAGKAYTIADMACVGWIKPYKRQGQDLADFPHLKRWFETVMARPAVGRGLEVGAERRRSVSIAKDKEAFRILFGQRAR
jgi:GST-like protein